MQASDNSAGNKRLAKNTIVLYVRMLFLMLISLYTSRVILNSLGVEDYGIYNVVGGVVSMFTILSGSLSAAISRFITFEMGTGNKEKLRTIFSSAVTIQIILAIIIILLAETIGLWFLKEKLVIPDNRMSAAMWCYQLSILTFSISLISIPYDATIIAHERMSAFAYISVLEAIGKLVVAGCIVINPIDRLVFWGLLMAVLSWIIRMVYASYCKRHFEECSYTFIYDKDVLKQMFRFAGWNFFGASSYQLMNQGVNILSNVYFGVTVNAARGIANQVNRAVSQFASNFMTALNPQITKSYASDQKENMYRLMFTGTKFSFYLILIFAVPIICEIKMVLELWLEMVPDYTISFVRLALVTSLFQVLSSTMVTAMLATGNIKKYQIIVGGLGLLVFPLTWIFFTLGYPPEMAYVLTLIIFFAQFVCRLFFMRDMILMSIRRYIEEVLYKIVCTSVLAFSIPVFVCIYIDESYWRFLLVVVLSSIITPISVMFVGLTENERQFVIHSARAAIKKIKG